jgi:hypothetical protein
MQQPTTSLLGYNAGKDGCGRAHLAEVILWNGSVEPFRTNGLIARGS